VLAGVAGQFGHFTIEFAAFGIRMLHFDDPRC